MRCIVIRERSPRGSLRKHWKLWVASPEASFVSWPCSHGMWAILGRKMVKGWMD